MNNKENESFGLLFALEQIKTETGFKIERDKDKPNLFYLIEPNSSAPFAELDFNEEIKNAKNHNQRITLRECAEIFAGRIRRIIQERSRRSLGESERSEAESRESRAESRERRAESERSENISIAGASFGNASAGFTSLQDMIIYRKDIGNAEPKKYIDVLAVLLNDFKKDMDKHKSSQNSSQESTEDSKDDDTNDDSNDDDNTRTM